MKPVGIPTHDLEQIVLEMDELEALRLCDEKGLSQEEAGRRIEVSRGTVQRLVSSGRKKLVRAILEQKALIVRNPDDDNTS